MEYNEILKLKTLLDKENIPCELIKHPLCDGWQLGYPTLQLNYRVCSVIECSVSYGNQIDLLEIQGLLTKEEYEQDDVMGCLTAEDVFRRIKQDFKKRVISIEWYL